MSDWELEIDRENRDYDKAMYEWLEKEREFKSNLKHAKAAHLKCVDHLNHLEAAYNRTVEAYAHAKAKNEQKAAELAEEIEFFKELIQIYKDEVHY